MLKAYFCIFKGPSWKLVIGIQAICLLCLVAKIGYLQNAICVKIVNECSYISAIIWQLCRITAGWPCTWIGVLQKNVRIANICLSCSWLGALGKAEWARQVLCEMLTLLGMTIGISVLKNYIDVSAILIPMDEY